MPAPHPVEFRQRAVQLARTGDKPIAVLAKELQISESCLRNWIAQADTDERGSDARLTSAEKKEFAELRRRNRGYLSGTACLAKLLLTVQLVAQGGGGFNASVAARLATVVRGNPAHSPQDPLDGLTKHESEVLELLARGYNNRGIARDLFLSERTVRNHLSRIF